MGGLRGGISMGGPRGCTYMGGGSRGGFPWGGRGGVAHWRRSRRRPSSAGTNGAGCGSEWLQNGGRFEGGCNTGGRREGAVVLH